MASGWQDIWNHMTEPCRDEIVLIEAGSLLSTLDNYLRKHRYLFIYLLFSTRRKEKIISFFNDFFVSENNFLG